jgi:hypothetical protein
MLNYLLLLLLNISPMSTPAQSDLLVLSDSLIENNILNFGGKEGWRFHPGDDDAMG